MATIKSFEMDHWVLFDTMSNDQIDRLKGVITKKVGLPEPVAAAADNSGSFLSMLNEETEKLS